MKSKSIFKLLILTISLLLNSCSDENNINSTQLLDNFQEPNLNFRITPEQLKQQEGIPDVEINIGVNGKIIKYLAPQDGVREFGYAISEEFGTGTLFYAHVNVHVFQNQQNLDYILDWLTKKYGAPEFNEFGDGTEGYEWYFNTAQSGNELFNISLVYSSNGFSANSTLFVDYSIF